MEVSRNVFFVNGVSFTNLESPVSSSKSISCRRPSVNSSVLQKRSLVFMTKSSVEDSTTQSDEDKAAETRKLLSSSAPQVSFRKKNMRYSDTSETDFTYTKGVNQGVDIWLITAILGFIVPVVILAYFVANGTVDLTPR
mmetsp:Transcript_12955/g.23293  ORF Transcript_12955/g.23293 Transcript_12955/m.23293 type:complete len:139 (-) Transcript_12955:37-453(-)